MLPVEEVLSALLQHRTLHPLGGLPGYTLLVKNFQTKLAYVSPGESGQY